MREKKKVCPCPEGHPGTLTKPFQRDQPPYHISATHTLHTHTLHVQGTRSARPHISCHSLGLTGC